MLNHHIHFCRLNMDQPVLKYLAKTRKICERRETERIFLTDLEIFCCIEISRYKRFASFAYYSNGAKYALYKNVIDYIRNSVTSN